MRRHKYIVGMRIQGRARDIALQQSLSERVRGKAHEYNCYCALRPQFVSDELAVRREKPSSSLV